MNIGKRLCFGLVVSAAIAVSSGAISSGNAQALKQVPRSELQVNLSYAPLVRDVAPAVVNVYTRKVVKGGKRRSPFAGDPLFERFFGDQFGGRTRDRVQSSLGSGVIVGATGIVVTNNHVIENGTEFKVVLSDRREFDAELILQDERTDLAVLKLIADGETFPTLEFFDSDDAEVGDLVLAIGNPFGVGQTVTSGIISALARTHVGVSDYQFFIQTDAPINPGNSGGALVAMNGKLIGVNTMIVSRSGGSVGIGFAIPADMVRLVVESAVNGGDIQRPWLGASGQTVTGDLAQSLSLDRPTGVLINKIHPGGPADKAGIEVGDVVLRIDGFEVNDMQSARYRLATLQIGDTTNVIYARDGEEKTTRLKLLSPPEEPPAHETTIETASVMLGVTVANLSPAFNEAKGLDTMKGGVMVVGISRRSPAARVGLRPGDVIVEINDTKIHSVADLVDVTAAAQRRWSIAVERGGRILRTTVRG